MDKGGDSGLKNRKKSAPTGKTVGIIGAGPAGLTAAYYLSGLGHEITIYDAFPKPGGMLRYGIPKYRIPEERLDRDIAVILDTNVEFRGNTVTGRDLTLQDIKAKHDAVLVATGANSSTKIPLEGADKENVLWGWEFLRDVALGQQFSVGENVVVVGGGNVAIDVALTARRLGAKHVNIFCLESREEMPAHPWEIELAEEEGVFINNSWAPKKVLGIDKVVGLGLIRCASVFDSACNFNPIYDEEITHKMSADTIILAIGQTPVLDFTANVNLRLSGARISADSDDLSTSEPGIFAAGDVVSGPASIIQGIAQGRKVAAVIDKSLGGSGDIGEELAAPENEVELDELDTRLKPRNKTRHLKAWERELGFDHVELPLNDEQIHDEASRCLGCDARKFEVKLKTESCKECGYCAQVCGVGTFGPAVAFNVKGYRPMEVKTSDYCVGCFKCFFSCPDFAIDVKEATRR